MAYSLYFVLKTNNSVKIFGSNNEQYSNKSQTNHNFEEYFVPLLQDLHLGLMLLGKQFQLLGDPLARMLVLHVELHMYHHFVAT